MAWFADTLQSACSADIADNNANAVGALIGMSTSPHPPKHGTNHSFALLIGLQTFDLMHDAGCLSDPGSNTYCYLNAVHNSNPSDLYFYQLPLGISLPISSTPTCTPCTKSLMGVFLDGLNNATTLPQLGALAKTYPSAAQLASKTCGTSYVQAFSSGGKRLTSRPVAALGVVTVTLLLSTWMQS